MREIIDKVQAIINDSTKIVFFGGAGVSTNSGIPDFRGTGGLYTTNISAETILSRTYFDKHPKEFFEFFRNNMMFENAKPNATHKKLAELEKAGKDITIVTQNIDPLHQMAGSSKVITLHGSITTSHCMKCNKLYKTADVINQDVPRCSCGNIIKPDVVLYEERLPEDQRIAAVNAIKEADTIIIAGTSMTVAPAKNMPKNHFRGKHMIIMNNEPTFMDKWSKCVIREDMNEIFSNIQVDNDSPTTIDRTFIIPYHTPYEFPF